MKKLTKWIGEKVYAWVNRNLPVMMGIAIVGIVCDVIGHYGQMGFNLTWFLFFELPLYLFLLWATYSVLTTYRNYKNK